VRRGLAGLADAWDMASTRPADLLGIANAEGLTAGAPASLVCFGWDGEQITVQQVYVNGRLMDIGQSTIDDR
jgi:N-acetylglucosamine-6-phosphate deacetylase